MNISFKYMRSFTLVILYLVLYSIGSYAQEVKILLMGDTQKTIDQKPDRFLATMDSLLTDSEGLGLVHQFKAEGNSVSVFIQNETRAGFGELGREPHSDICGRIRIRQTRCRSPVERQPLA